MKLRKSSKEMTLVVPELTEASRLYLVGISTPHRSTPPAGGDPTGVRAYDSSLVCAQLGSTG